MLSHELPPRRGQRIVHTPPTDILAICRTSVVLVYIRGCLPVEPGERIDVTRLTPPPALYRQSTSTFTSLRNRELGLTCGHPRCRMSDRSERDMSESGVEKHRHTYSRVTLVNAETRV
jgi:hypothetical protein